MKRGFTLIELLLVLAILAVLIGLLLPTLVDWRDKGEIERVKADIHTVRNAVEAYYAETGYLPVDTSEANFKDCLTKNVSRRLVPSLEPEMWDATTETTQWNTYEYKTGADANGYVKYYVIGTDHKKTGGNEDNIYAFNTTAGNEGQLDLTNVNGTRGVDVWYEGNYIVP